MGILAPGWKAYIYEHEQAGLLHIAIERPDGKVRNRWLTPDELQAFTLDLLNWIWGKDSEPVYWEDG